MPITEPDKNGPACILQAGRCVVGAFISAPLFFMESQLDILQSLCYYDYGKLTFHTEKNIGEEDTVKNRLEELRKERGIKQEELAAALEVSRQTIGSLENGRYNPSIILAFKLARYFDLSIEEIFIYEEHA